MEVAWWFTMPQTMLSKIGKNIIGSSALGAGVDVKRRAGPYIYRQDGYLKYDDKIFRMCGSHGCRHEFVLHCGNPEHPVTKRPSCCMVACTR